MESISVVLNVYKRPQMLERQIEVVLNQDVIVHPKDIHVWYNLAGNDQPDPEDVRINTYKSNWNTKFFGRFTIPLLCKTEYIAILDDDLLPGERWFSNCLETINNKEFNGILGGVGGILGKGLNEKFTRIGWNGFHINSPNRVDFVGQAWFFRQEWAKYMWYERPYSWDNAEDIMFCYLAQKHGGINSFVPPHPPNEPEIWCTSEDVSMKVGRDRNASWRICGHTEVRRRVCQHCIDNGWRTINIPSIYDKGI